MICNLLWTQKLINFAGTSSWEHCDILTTLVAIMFPEGCFFFVNSTQEVITGVE